MSLSHSLSTRCKERKLIHRLAARFSVLLYFQVSWALKRFHSLSYRQLSSRSLFSRFSNPTITRRTRERSLASRFTLHTRSSISMKKRCRRVPGLMLVGLSHLYSLGLARYIEDKTHVYRPSSKYVRAPLPRFFLENDFHSFVAATSVG